MEVGVLQPTRSAARVTMWKRQQCFEGLEGAEVKRPLQLQHNTVTLKQGLVAHCQIKAGRSYAVLSSYTYIPVLSDISIPFGATFKRDQT